MKKRIAVIYNEPKHTEPNDHWLSRSDGKKEVEGFRDASEFGVLEQMQSIAHALEEHEHEVLVFSADDDITRLCHFLETERPELIFNCCEAILGKASLEMPVAGVYELFGIPYTGSSALTLGIALNKGLSKDIFFARGISTPRHRVMSDVRRAIHADDLRFPLIVKPVREDASIGIDAKSIVNDANELQERVDFVVREFSQPALVEEYIDGRELNIGVIGDPEGEMETLPISEILFDQLPDGEPRIVSYEAKWVEESPLFKRTVPVCPADLPAALAKDARELALEAARSIGLRDYGRVDLRLRESDNALFVLEANPNPDISEDAGFMRAAHASGRSYAGMINEIVDLAMLRGN
jgi:D-alanine-D-alanine ligase